jgi:serine-type D-Ala-D-Ala carboxypeptidase (penicillin-binding protein 5/6)
MIIRKMKTDKNKSKRRLSLPLILLILFVIAYISWALPLPKIKAEPSYVYKSRPTQVSLAWPAYGQSAVGAVGYGILDSHGAQVTAPMASVTKVITALAVMKQKPLAPGNQGPTITITAEDVAAYNDYNSKGGSVVTVSEGEQISEYQALQAMLLPSANNMADTLARWAFGSIDKYKAFTNTYMKQLGMSGTLIDDASGFSPKSTSTAENLTALGLIFENNPVLKDVASQASAEIPVAGTIHSTNWLLGVDSVSGIKTGNTEEAGGCFLFASNRTIGGQPVTVVGAIMGAPDLNSALGDARPLIQSVDSGFSKVTVVKRDQAVGLYVAPWGEVANVLSRDDVNVLTWKTRQVASSLKIDSNKTSVAKNQEVGQLTATVWDKKATGKLIVDNDIHAPTWQWRLYKRHL